MKNLFRLFLPLLLLVPTLVSATTAAPWSITNVSDTFIFPNLFNGVAKGILVSASSTINSTLSVSSLTNGNCVQAGTGGLLTTINSGCGAGFGNSWLFVQDTPNYLIPTTSPTGVITTASSTLGNGTPTGGLTINGGATTTGNSYIAGLVGIGTNKPTQVNANAKLTVAGTGSQDIIASTTDSTTLSDAIVQVYSDASRLFMGSHGSAQVSSRFGLTLGSWGEITEMNNIAATPSAGLILGTNPAIPLVFGTNNFERARFLSTGEFGIGTTSPYALLSIMATSTAQGSPRTLFAIGSSTSAFATTTLFSVSNTGVASTTAVTIGGATIGTNALAWTGMANGSNGTITTSQPILSLSQTWNASGVVFAGVLVNITNTASAVGSVLADFQASGTSKVSFTAAGVINAAGSVVVGEISGTGNLRIRNAAGILSFGVSDDLILARDAANTLAQRNGVNPQTLRLYNTYTDAGNYERAGLNWASNILTIGTENQGTGSARNLAFMTGSTTRVTIDTSGNVGIGTTTPYGKLAVHANNGDTNKILFAVGSSTASATTTLFSIDRNGHITSTSTVPTLSTCGTGPSIVGGDTAGTVTAGAAANGCTITFAQAFTSVPTCVVSNQAASVVNATTYSVTATALTVSETGLGGSKFDFICLDH